MGILAQQYRTGLLQKQDPLPPGRYWIDVFDWGPPAGSGVNGIAMLDAWLSVNAPFVKVESSEKVDADTWYPASGNPAQEWVLFNVHDVPVPWGMQTQIGWPTVATQDVKQKSDTVQRPPEQSTPDYWCEQTQMCSGGKYSWVPWAAGGAIVLMIGLSAASAFRR